MPESSLLLSPRSHYGRWWGRGAPRPPVFRRHNVHSVLNALLALSADAAEVLPRFTLGRVLHRLGDRPDPLRGDRLGGRAVHPRGGRPAPPRRPLAHRSDAGLRGRRDGLVRLRHHVGTGHLRHHAPERPHGAAHDPVDGRAARPGARRAGHARPADAAGDAAPVAARRAPLPGGQGAVVPAAGVRALRRLAVGALLHPLVRRQPELVLRPPDDAHPPRAGRDAVLLAAHGHRPACPAASATRSACCSCS